MLLSNEMPTHLGYRYIRPRLTRMDETSYHSWHVLNYPREFINFQSNCVQLSLAKVLIARVGLLCFGIGREMYAEQLQV